MSWGVLFWHKCLNLMDKFVNDEVMQETPIMEHIKRKDPFIHLKTGPWGPKMDS